MVVKLEKGMRVRWTEEPHLDPETGKPNLLVGPQMGEIVRIRLNKKTKMTAVCVINRDKQHFHWIEAEHACEILSKSEY